MKITTAPAQKFRWAKRSLSIVVCTAMLLTAFVFANSVPASAYLSVEPAPPPSPVTFVVPETIYMTPVATGTATPQYFMSNNADGTAIKDQTLAQQATGYFYFEVPEATQYQLYYDNSGTTAITKRWDSGTVTAGSPQSWTVNTANTMFQESMPANSQNQVYPKLWRLVATVNGKEQEYYNYSIVYYPVYMPTVQAMRVARGGGGPGVEYAIWMSGLHKNWNGHRNGGGGDWGTATGKVRAHNEGTQAQRLLPLLGPAYFDADRSGGHAYVQGNTTLQNTTVGNTQETGRALYSERGWGDNDYMQNIRAGGWATGGNGNKSAEENAPQLNSAADWGTLYIDTSRHSHFGSIPNFGMGFVVNYVNRRTDNKVVNGLTPGVWFEGYSGPVTDTWDFGSVAGLQRISDTLPGANTAFSATGGSTAISELQRTRHQTNQAYLDKVTIERDWALFTNAYVFSGQGSNNDSLAFRTIFRVNTPRRDKSDLRGLVQESMIPGGNTAYLDALRDVCLDLGNPASDLTQTQTNTRITALKNALIPPKVPVGQHYHFYDVSGTNMVGAGDGTAGPFNTPTAAFTPDPGATYVTNDFTLTGFAQVELGGAVTAYRASFTGYNYTGMMFYVGPGADRVELPPPAVAGSTHVEFTDPVGRVEDVSGSGEMGNTIAVAYRYSPITYAVKYDANGGSGTMPNAPRSYNHQKPLDTNAYAKPGYTFAGWSAVKNGPVVYADAANVTNLSANPNANGSTVVTLYAVWTPKNDITVSFNTTPSLDPATPASMGSLEFNKPYGALATAARPGYAFKGWWTDAGGTGTEVKATTLVSNPGNHSLFARWEAEKFDIILDVNDGGDTLSPAALPAGEDFRLRDTEFGGFYPALPTPLRTGYTFMGWSTLENDSGLSAVVEEDDKIGGPPGDELDILAGDHRLYAQWTPEEYTVTFDPGGGVILTNPSGDSGPVYTMPVKFGKFYPALATIDPASLPAGTSGFDYWYIVDGDGEPVIAGSTIVTKAGPHTLKAKWIEDSPGVTFVKNGGVFFPVDTLSTKEVVVGEPYGILPTPTRPGYEFKGWWDTAAFDGAEVTAETLVPDETNLKIYAKWAAKDFTVTFMPEGGVLDDINPAGPNPAGAALTKTVQYGTAYGTDTGYPGLPFVVREGYTFDGWYLTAAFVSGEVEIEDITILGDAGTPANSHKLYARWVALKPTVTFDTCGGPIVPSPNHEKEVTFGAAYGALPVPPARTGYDFDGWWTSATAGTKVRSTTIVTDYEDHSVFAHWIAQPVKVTYVDTDGGNTFTPAFKDVEPGPPYGELPQPTRIGYDFDGWWSTPAYDDIEVTKDSHVPHDLGDHFIYAKWNAKEYTVKLDYDDGATPEEVFTVTFDEPYGIAELDAAPTRTGYAFDDWYLTGTVTPVASSDTVAIPKDHTIIARWIGDTRTLEFDPAGGTFTPPAAGGPKTIQNGKTYGEGGALPTPAMPGYDFKGWFWDVACTGAQVKDDTAVAPDDPFETASPYTLYAKWAAKTLKVSFDANGGTAITGKQDVTFGELYPPYASLPTTERAGYTFDEWMIEGGGSVVEGTTTVTLPTDHKLIAQWTPNLIEVNFAPEGGVFDPATDETRNVLFDGTYGVLSDGVTEQALPVPVRGGYALKGWYTEQNAPDETNVQGRRIKAGSKVTDPDSPQTLYAYWITADMEIKLYRNYEVTDPTYKEVGVTFGEEYGEALTPLERTGYTFVGWYDTPDQTGGNAVIATDLADNAALTELYARWAIKTPTVTFDSNGGSTANAMRTIDYGARYDSDGGFPADPTREGYEFAGWWTTSDAIGGAQVKADTIMNKEEPHSLYAHWKPAKYDVTFNVNGGVLTPNDPKSVTFGQTYGVLPTPTYDGYIFDGWWDTAACDENEATASSFVTKPAAHTLYAKWTPASFKLTFDGNGGAPAPASKAVTYLQPYGDASELVGTVWLPATRPGYNFTGWYTTATDVPIAGVQVLDTDTVTNTAAHTIYARWTAKTDIKVTLDPNGGDAVTTPVFDAAFGQAYLGTTSPNTGIKQEPIRTGYNFAGWYTEEKGGTLVDDSIEVTNPDDHTLYAHWTAKVYTLNFIDPQPDDPTPPPPVMPSPASKSITFGQAYGALATVPANPGYTFVGWYDIPGQTGGNKVEATKTVSDDGPFTLYARWIKDAVTVVFNFNYEDASPKTVTRTYPGGGLADYDHGTDGAMPLLSRTGYTGVWCTAPGASGGVVITAADIVDGTVLMLYARWTPDEYELKFEDSEFSLTPIPPAKSIYFDKAYGTLAAMPANPGYTFLGWYDTPAQTGGEKVEATKVVDTTDDPVTVYARWTASTYKLTLNYNYSGAPAATIQDIVYLERYDKNGALGTPVRTGYAFKGWSKNPNDFRDNGPLLLGEVKDDHYVTDTGNQILYAQWEAKAGIEVTLDSNGGSTVGTNVFNVTFGAAYGSNLNQAPLLAGSRFVGWFPTSAGPEGKVYPTSVVKDAADHTLYARWDSTAYGLYLEPCNGTTDWYGRFVEDGKPYSYNPEDPSTPNVFPTPVRLGYTFSGWYDAPTGGAKVAIGDTVPAGTTDSQHYLYARWTANSYTVTFDLDYEGAPAATSKPVTFDAAYGALSAQARAGYKFDGWFTSGGRAITKDTILNEMIINPPANHTLYAHWTQTGSANPPTTAAAKYKLEVRGGPGSGEYTAGSKVQIKATALPADTEFIEWVVVEGAGNVTIANSKSSSTTVTVNGDAIVAATYKEAPAKCKLQVRGGPGSGEYAAGSKVKISATALPADTEFIEWVVVEGGGKVTISNSKSFTTIVTVHGDAIIAATYRAAGNPSNAKYKLDVRGGPGTGEYAVGTVVPVVANALPPGTEFIEWVVVEGTAAIANPKSSSTTVTVTGNAIVAATYKDIGSGEKFIFSTRFRSTFWNWMMFIFLFGWIWMWFFRR